jgi:hypothetical protein
MPSLKQAGHFLRPLLRQPQQSWSSLAIHLTCWYDLFKPPEIKELLSWTAGI